MPPLPLPERWLLNVILPRAERDELLADLAAEFDERARRDGMILARHWLRLQIRQSAPALFQWNGWRAWTGFESDANAYRPGGPMFKGLFADVRYAARRLARRPAYTILSVLTLALGIGGTAAVFGIARPILFDELPYGNADQITQFWFGGSWNEQEFAYLRGRIPGYRAVAMYRQGDFTLTPDPAAPAQLVRGVEASTELFNVLGVSPMMGRDFPAGSDVIGAEPVVIISHGLWQELGARTDVIGTRLDIGGTTRTVIGVMPKSFWFPTPSVRMWYPQAINPERRNGSFTLVGHVAEGQDPANMSEHTARLVTMLDERFDYDVDWDKTKNAYVDPIATSILGPMRPAVIATLAGMALILLIACTNVAALTLGQVEGRATELGVRAALGASRRRLTQPLVVETLLIGVIAALVGSAFAIAGFGVLANALPIGAWSDTARFDWTLFAAALALAIGAALLVVIVPTSTLWKRDIRGDVQKALTSARTGGVHRGSARAERALVVVQVALAMLIATGASLLLRSVGKLYAIDPGIATEGVAVLDATSNTTMPAVERGEMINTVMRDLDELPGVASVAEGAKLPLRGGGNSFGITVEGRDLAERTNTFFRIVTPGYFETMGIQLLSGSVFDASTVARAGEVDVVINDALAKKYFPGENPIGRRVGGGFGVPQRIIGVVANVAEGKLTDDPMPARYFAHTQVAAFETNVSFVIRLEDGVAPAAVLDAARQTVNRVAPRFAVRQTTTTSRMFDEAVGPARQIMTLLALLSGLALVLGAVGIYGVVSHFVSRRMRDWAIRVALGMQGSGVIRRVLGQGTVLVVAGVVIGALGTLVLSNVLASLLYDVSRVDPLAFAGATVALLLTGMLAAFIPALRAARVDPALVLREQA